MATKIQIRGGTLAQWTTANPVIAHRELVVETDTQRLKIGNGSDVYLDLPYAYSFVDLADANETAKGIVEEASDAETIAGTATGGTGAKLFVSPQKLKTVYNLSPIACAPSGGVISLDCANRQEAKFLCSTISANATISLANATNLIVLHLTIPITGTAIQLTWPTTVRMSRYQEATSGDGWYQSTKILQVSSVGTADLWEFSLVKMGSVYKLNYDGPARA